MQVINGFRLWQAEAHERFYGQLRCYLIAPPGQGKSIAGQAWARYWFEQGRKVLIATPRRLILDSFKGEKTLGWDESGKVDSPSAVEHTFKYVAPDCDLATWLITPLDNCCPYFVNTHSGALAALRALQDEFGDTAAKYQDLAVVIDEAHLMRDSEDSELSKVLKDLIAHGVPVLIMTGTPYRGDDKPILSRGLEKTFTIYTREFYLALDEAAHLCAFETKVIVGNTLAVLEHILSTFEAEDRYAVVKLPRVGTHHALRLARELGIETKGVKEEAVIKQLKLRFDQEIEAICQKLGLSHLSVVKDNSQDSRLEKILKSVRGATRRCNVKSLPRVIVTQDKIGLGVDCPWWTDSIMLGASRSCTETVQFGMRCCRDHFSKASRSARYWTLVPEYWEPEVTADQAFDFAKDLVATQLWWHFIGGGPVAPYLKTSQSLPSTGGQGGTSAVPRSPKEITDASMMRSLGGSWMGGADTPYVSEEDMPSVNVEVYRPDGSLETHRVGNVGDGNRIYPMDPPKLPEGTIKTGSFLSQLKNLAEVLVARGKGKEYHSMLNKAQVTPKFIAALHREGKSVGEISSETGWTTLRVETTLQEEGLIVAKARKPRIRGGKEDQY